MRCDQREQVVTDFMKARLPKKKQKATVTELEDSLFLPSIENGRRTSLDISSEDSGIESISIVTLDGMWTKAEDLINKPNSITAAPGSNSKDRMVLSYSQVKPHYVQYKDSGQYMCDSECPQWCSSQICSHVLAVAQLNCDFEKFLLWFVQHAGRLH